MGQKIEQAVIDKVIELRHNEVRYEDVAEILGIKERTVRSICSKNGCLYADIEDAWKAKVEELRKAGYDYTEVAEILDVDREEVEKYCQSHNLKYQDLGNENRHAHMGGGWNKGIIRTDWSEKVKTRTDGKFELVERKTNEVTHEQMLLIRCTACGSEKSISSISLRGNGKLICRSCQANDNSETESRHEFEKWQRGLRKAADKNRKSTQLAFKFCKDCGALIENRRTYCSECSEKHYRDTLRKSNRNSEHKRRIRMGKDFDKDITLERLYNRDQGVCYLCNETCDWSDFQIINDAFVVGGRYPTVEHVKALAKGGTHTWDNVRLACFACNTKKGTKDIEEIALRRDSA